MPVGRCRVGSTIERRHEDMVFIWWLTDEESALLDQKMVLTENTVQVNGNGIPDIDAVKSILRGQEEACGIVPATFSTSGKLCI